jgi:hypothetical protein
VPGAQLEQAFWFVNIDKKIKIKIKIEERNEIEVLHYLPERNGIDEHRVSDTGAGK